MKIDRLLSILMMLINKKKVTAKELSEYFEVSVRTIQRDMDTLSMSGVPIYADVGKNGGYQLLDNYKLNKSFLNKNEASILIEFLKNLEQTAPYSEVKSIYNKFLTTMPTSNEEENKLIIKMNPWISQEFFKNNLNVLAKARDELKKVHIQYYDMNFINTSRIICPYTLAMLGSIWYVYAYCELRHGFRMFKLSRIISCEILKENYELKELPEILPWQNNMDSGRKSVEIILKIDKILQGKLPDYFSFENCEIKEDHILVTMHFPIDEWIYTLLMSLVPHVEIVEPCSLREEFIKRLQAGINKNI